MSLLRKLKYFLPGHRKAVEDDVREELASLAAIAESEGDRAHLGNLTRAAEDARATWTWGWLDHLRADLRHAFRAMRRNPGFTATAIVSLSLGIGANIAIFGFINALLLKPLPVHDPDSLVMLSSFGGSEKIGDFGYPDYIALRDSTSVFTALAAASNLAPAHLTINRDTTLLQRKIVSANYFSTLAVQPMAGRIFHYNDDAKQIAVISHRLWTRAFSSSPTAIGASIELEGLPFTVIGIAPPEFIGETIGEATDIWVTMSLMPADRRNAPGYTWLNLMARLRPGISHREAHDNVAAALPHLRNRFIDRVSVESGSLGGSSLRNTFALPLKILLCVVGVVLLIGCANLASLLLARAAARRREIATRLAIGASHSRVIRQMLTESVLLGLLGGIGGLMLAIGIQRVLLVLIAGAGRTVTLDLRPDIRVLFYAAALSIAAGLLFGFAPALQAIRENVGESLKLAAQHAVRRPRRLGIRDGLIAIQVALSFMLLVVGGLFIRTLYNLKTQDLGFQPDNVLCLQIVPEQGYKPQWPNLIEATLRHAEAVPGVHSATVSFNPTLSNAGSGVSGFTIEGQPSSTTEERARANWVGPAYFRTSGIPLLAGRDFTSGDTPTTQRNAIINQSMARHYFGNNSAAIGRHFEFNKANYRIVGVAKDAKYQELRESTPRFIYFAALQHNKQAVHSLEVRTAGSPLAVAAALQAAVRQAEPRVRIRNIATLNQRVQQKLARELLLTDIATFFAGLTLLLVCVGAYGSLAYNVARRSSEIGIRMALGARPAAILRLVLRDAILTVTLGLVAGAALSLAAGKLVRSMLFGLTSTDPLTIVTAAVVLAISTLVAAYLPVRRAVQVEPTAALRLE